MRNRGTDRLPTRRLLASGLLVLASGCAPGGAPGQGGAFKAGEPSPAPPGTLSITVRWPQRRVEAVPLSTQAIRLRVLKGDAPEAEIVLSRPSEQNGSLAGQASLHLDAFDDFTVRAEAFRASPIASADLPIASAVATGVAVVANQRTALALNLRPSFEPILTTFSPANGGPGVPIVLSGNFSSSGFYGVRIGGAAGAGSLQGQNIVASVPTGAKTGPVIALDDGVPSAPGATFSVLLEIVVSPSTIVLAPGATLSFAVSEGTDPASPAGLLLGASHVGGIDENGIFTARATGDAIVRAFSGWLAGTASVSVR